MTIDRPRTHAEHPDDEHADGEWGTQFPFSQPGDWVALADVSHGAKALYYVYCGHVNKKKNGEWVWPSQKTLANILRATEKTVRKWIVELEQIRAIIVTEVIDPRNGHKRLMVTVNQAAPEGYDGYIDYKSYYHDHRELKAKVQGTLVEAADAKEPRTPPVKTTAGPTVKNTGGDDLGKQEPPVKTTEGQGAKTTEGLGAKSTEEEYEDKKTKGRTHTPPSPPEATGATEPGTETGVCVEDSEEQDLRLKATLKSALSISPAFALVDNDQRGILLNLGRQCLHAGITTDTIGARLALKIDERTTEPFGWAQKVLQGLIDNARSNDPFADAGTAPKADEYSRSWIDPDGTQWPVQRPDQRHCKGSACSDRGFLRYVSIDNPHEGAFSCPVCREEYKVKATA